MIEIKDETEKVILVGVALSDQDDTKESLEELKDLVSTAGAETAGMLIQNREQQHPATYVGKGKIEELKNMGNSKNTLVLLDYALSLPDRRLFAKKIKASFSDKIFAVIDRVLLMFLVNNYSVQFINQILMSVMIRKNRF